ncbi:MAG: hypothetical protein H6818_22415 [Phycisphaerales bacterium]|nr:hypothetical protein [Phycisphaerales bacterium]
MMRFIVTRTCVVGCLCLLLVQAEQVVADESPQENATSRFLGTEAEVADASLVLQQASPLFGGREYYVSGSGRIVIVDIRRGREPGVVERRFEILDASKQTKAIFQKLQSVDLLGIPLEQADRPRRTCTNPPLFILRNSKGEVRALPMVKAAPTKEFDDVLNAVASLILLTSGREPVHEGAYDTGFIPKGFEWTAPILTPGKEIRWAPHASAAEVEQAEREYREKVAIQLKQLEQNQGKEGAESVQPADDKESASENSTDSGNADHGNSNQ